MDDQSAQAAQIDRQKDISPFALFIGPVMLGSFVANGLFRIVCEGRSSFTSSGTPVGSPFIPFFIIFGTLGALRLADPLLRTAFGLLALWESVRFYAWMTETRVPSAFGWMNAIAAAMFIAAGMRSSVRHRVLIASSLFVVVLVFSFWARRNMDSTLGRDTVFRTAAFCSSQN